MPVLCRQILVVAFTIVSVGGSVATEVAPLQSLELSQVDVQVAAKTAISTEVRISGSLSAVRRSTLTSRVASTVVELPVQIGDVVKAGDLLVRFDSEALISSVTAKEAEIDALNAQIELAQSVLERNTALGERGAAVRLESRANLLNLKAQLRSKQAELADSKRSLAFAELRAEFDGVVASRQVDQGQLRVDMQSDVVALPSSSIRRDGEGTYVLIIKNGLFERRPVTFGESWNDRDLVQVKNVEEGDVVVVSPIANIKSGMRVKLEDR